MPMQFKARWFGPDTAAVGTPVDVSIDAVQLRYQPPGGYSRSVPLTQVALRAAGFNDGQWELGWTDADDGRQALLVDDAATLAALRRNPPPALASAIDAITSRARRRSAWRGLAWSAVSLWVALPLLLVLALFASARPLSGWLAERVPIAHEVRLGDWFFETQARRLDLVKGTLANRVIEQIGARLTQGSRYPYRWHVARDPTLNAFAVPGGIIVVHSGLIEAADSAEELAGVLAHEVEHVERRHSLKAMLQQAGLRVTLAAVIGDLGLAGGAAGELASLHFSRESEREADAGAIERLHRAGISAFGMPALFDKLGRQGGSLAPAWLATHPTTAERVQHLREALSGSEPAVPLPYDWNAVRASIEAP